MLLVTAHPNVVLYACSETVLHAYPKVMHALYAHTATMQLYVCKVTAPSSHTEVACTATTTTLPAPCMHALHWLLNPRSCYCMCAWWLQPPAHIQWPPPHCSNLRVQLATESNSSQCSTVYGSQAKDALSFITMLGPNVLHENESQDHIMRNHGLASSGFEDST